ncbi:hypothetical protein DL764_001081 [Monosporascus ibericus]|uniref:NmrA-like domain-containing protein n=1 Tax=Monosporascus ibericus TaxID=155417 RepID=A0A4Q4TQY0_9PEZI|nr:hypothetical protein DL764_001081 [Monosporascus ibericus]
MLDNTILVTGATGTQGGATVQALLQLGYRVRVLVRSSSSPASQKLSKLGAEMALGDFDDISSLETAVQGVNAIFLNVSPSLEDPEAETRHANNVITAAAQAGGSVQTLVYNSTVLTGQHHSFPSWETWNDFARQYWLSKAANEDRVRASGISNWTILRPCTFMTNYLQPLAPFFFPELLSQGVFRTALGPETPTMLIDPDDIGRFAAAALTQPARFHGQEIDLGAEALTPPEIAMELTRASGRNVKAEYIPQHKVKELIPQSHIISAQTFFNERSAQIDALALEKRWGLTLTKFAEFLDSHQNDVKKSFTVQ